MAKTRLSGEGRRRARFEIIWRIAGEDWESAADVIARHEPGSEYDVSRYALDDLLPGSIQFSRNGHPIPPVPIPVEHWQSYAAWAGHVRSGVSSAAETSLANGYTLPILDLACQLAYVLNHTDFRSATSARDADYHEAMESQAFRFHKETGEVAILSNALEDAGWMLQIPEDEYFRGLARFLESFATELRRRIPSLATWRTFEELAPFVVGGA